MKHDPTVVAVFLLISACGPGRPPGASGGNGAATGTPASSVNTAAGRDVIVLASDTGDAAVRYRCDAPQLGRLAPGQRPAIRDYVARMLRMNRVSDPDSLQRLTAAYEAQDWSYLEAKAVADACANGLIPSHTPVFPEGGTLVPDLVMRRLDGQGTVRFADLRGAWVMVDFWSTTCVPCLQELPMLDAWALRSPDRLKVLAVPYRDDPARARLWLRRHLRGGVIGIEDPDSAIARAFRAGPATPDRFLIDPEGRVVPGCDACNYRERLLPDMEDVLRRALGWDEGS